MLQHAKWNKKWLLGFFTISFCQMSRPAAQGFFSSTFLFLCVYDVLNLEEWRNGETVAKKLFFSRPEQETSTTLGLFKKFENEFGTYTALMFLCTLQKVSRERSWVFTQFYFYSCPFYQNIKHWKRKRPCFLDLARKISSHQTEGKVRNDYKATWIKTTTFLTVNENIRKDALQITIIMLNYEVSIHPLRFFKNNITRLISFSEGTTFLTHWPEISLQSKIFLCKTSYFFLPFGFLCVFFPNFHKRPKQYTNCPFSPPRPFPRRVCFRNI